MYVVGVPVVAQWVVNESNWDPWGFGFDPWALEPPYAVGAALKKNVCVCVWHCYSNFRNESSWNNLVNEMAGFLLFLNLRGNTIPVSRGLFLFLFCGYWKIPKKASVYQWGSSNICFAPCFGFFFLFVCFCLFVFLGHNCGIWRFPG